MCSVSKLMLKLKTRMKMWKLERAVDRELDLSYFLSKLNGQNTNSTFRLYFLLLNFINFFLNLNPNVQ